MDILKYEMEYEMKYEMEYEMKWNMEWNGMREQNIIILYYK